MSTTCSILLPFAKIITLIQIFKYNPPLYRMSINLILNQYIHNPDKNHLNLDNQLSNYIDRPDITIYFWFLIYTTLTYYFKYMFIMRAHEKNCNPSYSHCFSFTFHPYYILQIVIFILLIT